MTNWKENSDEEVAEAYAEVVRLIREKNEELDILKDVKDSVEFEFLARFDEKFRKQHKFWVDMN